MNNQITLEWRELTSGNSELYLICSELEINCTELIRDHYYYFEYNEIVELDKDEIKILDKTINNKRLVQLFDGSNYTIIDETGKIIFDHLEYIEFINDSSYFLSYNSYSNEYCLYSISNTEAEFTSEFEITYDSKYDIFHMENEIGNHEVIYQGVRYSSKQVLERDHYTFKSKDIEIILTPIDDVEDDSILLVSSPNQLPNKYFLEKYSIISSYNYEWIIINHFGEQFEIILGDGNCIRLEKNLSIATFSLSPEELIFAIQNDQKNEIFLVVDEFEKILKLEISYISTDIILRYNHFFLPAKEYFLIENKVVGNFLIIYGESKRSDYQFATIYKDSENIWDFEVPIEQTKDPLLCLQYAFIEQSTLKNIST
jgi:hypothetical protein